MTRTSLLGIGLALALAGGAHAEAPKLLAIQGRLALPGGAAVTDPTSLTLSLWDADTGGTQVHAEVDVVTPDSNGVFATTLGDEGGNALDLADFDQTLWLATQVEGGPELGPRAPLRASPYALRSLLADDLDAGSPLVATVNQLVTDMGTVQAGLAVVEGKTASISTSGTDLYFDGVNVHIRDGSGSTGGAPNGLGNLILGYNEDAGGTLDRSGSHNLVLGEDAAYPGTATIQTPAPGEESGFLRADGADALIQALTLTADGSGASYVAGDFQAIRGRAAAGIARLGPDLVPDPGFDPGTGFDNSIRALVPTTDGSGDLLVAGSFTTYDGSAAPRIARLDPDGSLDTGFDPGTGFGGTVNALALAADGSGDVYAGGSFTTFDGASQLRLARLDSDGSLDAGFAIGTGPNSTVAAIAPAVDGSGDVYIAGYFTSYNGTGRARIARLNSDGSLDAGFDPGTGPNIAPEVLLPATDGSGDIYIGGSFTSYAGTAVGYMARLDSDGSLDVGFALGSGFDSSVYSLAHAADGSEDVFAGGFFTELDYSGVIDGVPSAGIARLHPDGSRHRGFAAGLGAGFEGQFSIQTHVAPRADGTILVAGNFGSFDGTPVANLALLDPGGTLHPLSPSGAGFLGSSGTRVRTIVDPLDGSGDVLVGGDFETYDGQVANGILRLNADGSPDIDPGFDAGVGFLGSVYALAVTTEAGGSIYAGGPFSYYRGVVANQFIRTHPDGSRHPDWFPGSGPNGIIHTLAPALDGSGALYLGGAFSTYGSSSYNKIVRVHANGSKDLGFVVGSGFGGNVNEIVAVSDGSGDIYVGGAFFSYQGNSAFRRLIRLDPDGSVDATFVTTSGFDSDVLAIAVAADGSGDVYAGGSFTTFDGQSAPKLVRVNADGSLDGGFAVGTGFDGTVHDVLAANDASGDVYVSGTFENYQGSPVPGLVRLNSDGSLDPGFDVGLGPMGSLPAIDVIRYAPDGSGDLLLGGAFASIDGHVAGGIARLSSTGELR